MAAPGHLSLACCFVLETFSLISPISSAEEQVRLAVQRASPRNWTMSCWMGRREEVVTGRRLSPGGGCHPEASGGCSGRGAEALRPGRPPITGGWALGCFPGGGRLAV